MGARAARVFAGVSLVEDETEAAFRAFVTEAEPRLRRALIAAYGYERGREATAEALAYAWENWVRLRRVENLTGYLYRVGQSRTRRNKTPVLFERATLYEPLVEPALRAALAELPQRQRVAVFLAHGAGWTHAEVAELMGVKAPTVQKHVERGLVRLRQLIVSRGK
jgi:DNA-directed RNA polymerase specialized sigma24 family protein